MVLGQLHGQGIGWVLPPPQYQSIFGVLLRAIYNHVISIIQLLLCGGSTQGIGLQSIFPPIHTYVKVLNAYSWGVRGLTTTTVAAALLCVQDRDLKGSPQSSPIRLNKQCFRVIRVF